MVFKKNKDQKQEDSGSSAVSEETAGCIDEIAKKVDRISDTRGRSKIFNYIVRIIAVAMALFHIYTSTFGILVTGAQRSVHLGFALVLVLLLYPGGKSKSWKFIDGVLAIIAGISFMYYAINAQAISERFSYVTRLSNWQMLVAIAAVILILECTRRVVTPIMSVIVLVFLAYAFFGQFLTPLNIGLGHRGFSPMWIFDHLFYTTASIFGTPIGTSATFIFMFVLFGTFLEKSGAGKIYIDIANALMGRFRGGAAKTAIFAAGLMGMISGSAVANVATVGPICYPMMKKTGYDDIFSGGVIAVASTGGQIMPPVMGAAAFVIAEMCGVSYGTVALCAAIPAVLYYVSVGVQVHFRAVKIGLKGLTREETPDLVKVFASGFLFFIPLVLVVYFLMSGASPMKAGLWATISVLAISFIKKETRLTGKQIIEALEASAKGMLQVALACAAAGIIIGIVTLTGLGILLSTLIVKLAAGKLIILLILTMITSIILGMGLPTVAAYLVQVALTVPAIVALGVPLLSAHLFVFYFSIISAITPPVALAAYASAAVCKSDPFTTGWVAFKLGIAAFIVPFAFIYGPALLLMGTVVKIIYSIGFALVGIVALAAGLEAYLRCHTNWYERVLLFISAGLMIYPELITSITGAGILIGTWLIQTARINIKNTP